VSVTAAAPASVEERQGGGGSFTPAQATAVAEPWKRLGVAFGRRLLLLLAVGLVWIAPAFRDRRFLFGMLLWDALLLVGWVLDLRGLPHPSRVRITRRWLEPLALAVDSQVQIFIENGSSSPISVRMVDGLPTALRASPPELMVEATPGESSVAYDVHPSRRGDASCGYVFLRYQSGLALAERWARADLRQLVRVYPNLKEAERDSIYLMRSRQIEMEKRFLRLRGEGREFESLREYHPGDDLRDICWTATARRAKPITKIYQIERSQPVWLVLDCGRLMRTRVGEYSKLDSAVNAALSLAEVAIFSGDRVGLLAYGRSLKALVPPGRGSPQVRRIIERLALVQEEVPEADHLHASSALLARQRRRALVIWLTDLAETAMMPEVVQGAMKLIPPHLLLFVAISQPDLRSLAAGEPQSPESMFRIAAAQELINRRERLLAQLRERGALALECDWRSLSTTLVNEYLKLKEQSRI